jgi:hypothetical protein
MDSMAHRLFVGVLGHRNSGKSRTWNELFGRTVRRGTQTRYLELRPNECVEVFLISGSFEERKEYAGDILKNQNARIILCSIQYTEEVFDTIDYIVAESFDIFVQWLNPGHSDGIAYFDRLGIAQQLLSKRSTLALRDGTVTPASRVQEMKQFIYGWAVFNGLIVPCLGGPSL